MSGRVQTVRKRLEVFKYLIYVSVPLVFGYGLGRWPGFWESASEVLPSAAANPSGPYLPKDLTADRPTLQSEFQKLALERALDQALIDVRKSKAAKENQAQQ